MTSFFSLGTEQRIKKINIPLKKQNLLDWKRIKKRLKGLYKKDVLDQGGQRPYDPLKMFKVLLQGQGIV